MLKIIKMERFPSEISKDSEPHTKGEIKHKTQSMMMLKELHVQVIKRVAIGLIKGKRLWAFKIVRPIGFGTIDINSLDQYYSCNLHQEIFFFFFFSQMEEMKKKVNFLITTKCIWAYCITEWIDIHHCLEFVFRYCIFCF